MTEKNKIKEKHKVIRTILKVLGIILAILVIIAIAIYFTVLRYPEIKSDPTVGKWYRVSSEEMKASDGSGYHALFKKGSEKNVMVYFAGGGVSVNEATARNDTYNTILVWPDMLANITMNMGGLATAIEGSPFEDWTLIMFPYATGDFHCGAGEFAYTDKDGREKILYHNGYINFTSAMDEILEKAGIKNPDSVIVTGYSAGGWAAAILAEDVFTTYFPNAESKVVLVDSAVALNENWGDVAENVWKTPEHIVNRIHTNNLTLDCLTALYDDLGDDVEILFGCSVRDGDLSKIQRYFMAGEMDGETGEMPIEDADGDTFQQILKEFVAQLQEETCASVFIWDGMTWYDRPYNLTSHTIISTPAVFVELGDTGKSIAEWLNDAVNGTAESYGLELLDKTY